MPSRKSRSGIAELPAARLPCGEHVGLGVVTAFHAGDKAQRRKLFAVCYATHRRGVGKDDLLAGLLAEYEKATDYADFENVPNRSNFQSLHDKVLGAF